MAVPAGQEVQVGQAFGISWTCGPFRRRCAAQGTLKQTEADLDFAQRQVSLRRLRPTSPPRNLTCQGAEDYERLKPLLEQDAV